MPAAVVSDVHVHNFKPFGGQRLSGINERCHATLASLAQAVGIACTNRADDFVITGDLFDTSSPTPQVVSATIDVLRPVRGTAHLLAGNHDQFSMAEGDHALGPLHGHTTKTGEIKMVADISSAVVAGVDSLFLPFRPEPVGEWLLDAVRGSGAHTVFAHFGVADEATPKWLLKSPDAVGIERLFRIMKKSGVQRFVVGNWHDHKIWEDGKRSVIQVGALVPTGFNNPGKDYGRVVILDERSFKVERVTGPRFCSTVWGADLRREIRGYGKQVYVLVSADPSEVVTARSWMAENAAALGVVGWRVEPNKKEANRLARSAAAAAGRADTLKAACAAFVAKMPLEEGVSREAVLSRVHQYLSKAKGADK